MPKTLCRFVGFVCLGLAVLVPVGWGYEPVEPTVLFDGKTLDGWKRTEGYKAGAVAVADGAIRIEAGGPISGVACTRANLPVTNFELTYEAQRVSGDDFFAAATFPVGTSFLTLVNGGWGGSVTGLSSLNGSDASENETRKFVKYQNGTWYRFRVQVTDDAIRCWLDDKEICVVGHRGRQVKTRIEMRANQPLGFATYRSTALVRAIQVRPLIGDEITAVNKAAEER